MTDKTMRLSNLQISTLDGRISYDPEVTHLFADNNILSSLPSNLSKIYPNLATLSVAGNALTDIEAAIASMSHLRTLNISKNLIRSLPKLMPPELTGLNAGRNPMSSITQVFELARLTSLNLDGVDLSSFVLDFNNNLDLRELSLSGCELRDLAQSVFFLPELRKLDLSDNHLLRLPEAMSLEKLTALDISANAIRELPNIISALPSLKYLEASDNLIGGISQTDGFSAIEGVSFKNNEFDTLPAVFANSPMVRRLDFTGNAIETVDCLGLYWHLTKLILTSNRLTSLPDVFTASFRLKTLELDNNFLMSLPESVANLSRLNRLWLDENSFDNMPDVVFRLNSLVQLTVSGNNLNDVPPAIASLAKLKEFQAARNRIRDLPSEIGTLHNLDLLNLEGNELTSLPDSLAEMIEAGLTYSFVNNPFYDPIPEALEAGSRVLASYLRSLGDARPNFESKMLLVGEGNVGKTSLVAALRNEPFIDDRPTTHGIEVNAIAVKHPEIEDVTLKVKAWDFGGQEVYRVTHQFFFTSRALYLVVWHAREGHEQNDVEGWLKRIRLRVESPYRVILVATHSSSRIPEVDFPALVKRFPALTERLHAVDNSSQIGISELRDSLAREVAALPIVGSLFSSRWLKLREDIDRKAASTPHLSLSEFSDACRAQNIGPQEQLTLARLLNDLGNIIYFPDDVGLQDIIVLDPEWLTKAISYVLEDHPTRANGGVLDHTRLKEIWINPSRDQTYLENYHPYFIRLMEKFDVSFRISDSENMSLVAQLVPFERPLLDWTANTSTLNGRRRLSLLCDLSEDAPGLISWLTVRHHRASTGKHWRHGVFLRYPISEYDCEAIIELESETMLRVTVDGPSPDLFFNVIRVSIEDLFLRRWPGLEFRLLVPCQTRYQNGSNCEGVFKLRNLLRSRESGRESTECHDCLREYDVSELLTGFAQDPGKVKSQLEDIRTELQSVATQVRQTAAIAADTSDTVRRLLKGISEEISDCPRLFTITPESARGLRRLLPHEEHFELVLWCEHTANYHPLTDNPYHIHQPKSWVNAVGPYLSFTVKTLQIVATLAVPGTALLLTKEQTLSIEGYLKLAKAVTDKLPVSVGEVETKGLSTDINTGLNPAEGAGLRAFRTMLLRIDKTQEFADLRRVQDETGGTLWVCPEHYKMYDPGLPELPEIQD